MENKKLSPILFNLKFNVFDVFVTLLFLLGVASAYLTFVKPIQFSNLIVREDKPRLAELEFILPDDLSWIVSKIRVGEESRNIYGQVEWKILDVKPEIFSGKQWVKVTVKILVSEKDSGIVRYGKYTLVPGGKIYLVNPHFGLEGRVYRYRLLNETVIYK